MMPFPGETTMLQLFLAITLAAAAAPPAVREGAEGASDAAASVAGTAVVERIVWTNDHLEQRFGLTPTEPFEPAAAPEPRRYVREQDPAWYRARLAPLEEELAAVEARAARIRQFLAAPRDYAQPGLVLRLRPMRLSPENELELLAARRGELLAGIRTLQQQARRHWLPPGALR